MLPKVLPRPKSSRIVQHRCSNRKMYSMQRLKRFLVLVACWPPAQACTHFADNRAVGSSRISSRMDASKLSMRK